MTEKDLQELADIAREVVEKLPHQGIKFSICTTYPDNPVLEVSIPLQKRGR